MGSKKQIAAIVSALAFVPATTLANAEEVIICDPDKQLTRCEKALKDSAVIWESRAEEARVSYHGCLDKLKTRTATVVNNLVMPPRPTENGFPVNTFIVSTSVTFALGVLIGVLVAR